VKDYLKQLIEKIPNNNLARCIVREYLQTRVLESLQENGAFVKGRDIYDLMWYLSDRAWPGPNIVLLNNALKQTGWKGKKITADNWRKETAVRISKYDWDKVITDVRPFVEKQRELEMLTKENLLKLLQVG